MPSRPRAEPDHAADAGVSPQRIIGGVVVTRVATLSVTSPSGGVAFIGRVDAAGRAGFVQHTVTESDCDAFPETC